MSYSEYVIWTKYRKKYGPINPVRMYDQGSAIVSSVIAQVNGNNDKKIEDFIFYGKEETELSVTDFIRVALKGKVNHGRSKRR